jgi:hypothetical protein
VVVFLALHTRDLAAEAILSVRVYHMLISMFTY